MCVIFFAHKVHPNYPLVVLANRDEFYDRPTEAAHRWQDHPQIYAGRDLLAGGTWLGVTDAGRFAAVTNYREPNVPKGELSRGALVADFLKSDQQPEEFLEKIASEYEKYSGFNLIAGIAGQELYYYSNRAYGVQKLNAGIYGLSNHLLNTSWPKVTNGLARFEQLISNERIDISDCFELLSDKTLFADAELPDTGVGIERERLLSPIFIQTSNYGTRSSTVLVFDREGKSSFSEKVFL